jgi:hypothetical protein
MDLTAKSTRTSGISPNLTTFTADNTFSGGAANRTA